MSKYVRLPKSLTAENGAKAELSGEFYEIVTLIDKDGNEYYDKIAISWSSIKDIYKRVVEKFGIEDESQA